MRGDQRDGLLPVADVNLHELLELQSDLDRYVERRVAWLRREERLLRDQDVLLDGQTRQVPGDLSGRGLRKFSDYVRLR